MSEDTTKADAPEPHEQLPDVRKELSEMGRGSLQAKIGGLVVLVARIEQELSLSHAYDAVKRIRRLIDEARQRGVI